MQTDDRQHSANHKESRAYQCRIHQNFKSDGCGRRVGNRSSNPDMHPQLEDITRKGELKTY